MADPGQGQVLDLSGEIPPRLVRPSALDALVEELGQSPAGRPDEAAGQGHDALAAEAMAAWRSAARTFIEHGRSDKPGCNAALVIGLAMSRATDSIDKALGATGGKVDGAQREKRDGWLRAFTRSAGRLGPASIASDDAAHRLARELAGELARGLALEMDAHRGWTAWPCSEPAADRAAAYAKRLEAVRATEFLNSLPAEARQSAGSIVASAESAKNEWGYRAVSQHAITALYSGARCFEGLRGITESAASAADGSTWAAPAEVDPLRGAVGMAIVRAAAPATQRSGFTELRVAGHLADIFEFVMRTERFGPQRVPLEAALKSLLRRAADEGLSPGVGEAAAAYRRVLDVVSERLELPARSQLPSELRRAWAGLEAEYALAERAAIDSLMGLGADPAQLARPEGASLLSRLRRAIGAQRDLLEARAFVEWRTAARPPANGPRAPTAPSGTRAAIDQRTPLGKRYAELVRELELNDTREAAVDRLRAFAQERRRWAECPGETRLNAGDAAMARALSGRGADVRRAIDEAREAWAESALGDAKASAAAAARLSLLRRLLALALLYSQLNEPGAIDGALAWSGLEFPPEAVARLVSDLPAKLEEPLRRVLDENAEAAGTELGFVERRTAALRLLGRVSHRMGAARQNGDGKSTAELTAAVLFEIAEPPPADGWLADERGSLAPLSRWMHELGPAQQSGNDERAAEIERYINHLATRLSPPAP